MCYINKMNTVSFETPIGRLTIAAENGFITNIFFSGEEPPDNPICADEVVMSAKKQIEEYFSGKRKVFDLPLITIDTATFGGRVRKAMLEIPFGKTVTYGDLAARAGNPKAARAAGSACNRNPIPIIIPCHRVVGKNGNLTGFRGGLDIKRKLLEVEST